MSIVCLNKAFEINDSVEFQYFGSEIKWLLQLSINSNDNPEFDIYFSPDNVNYFHFNNIKMTDQSRTFEFQTSYSNCKFKLVSKTQCTASIVYGIV